MELFAERAPWFVAGPLLGLLVTALLWATNRPLGSLGGYIDLIGWVRNRSAGLKFTVYFLAGTILGGLLSTLLGGGSHLTLAYGTFDARYGTDLATRSAALVVGGLVMGYGARTASGCTSGHGICGTALGSPRSWVSTAVFMATAIVATQVTAWWVGIR